MAIESITIHNKSELEAFVKERRMWQPDFDIDIYNYPVILTWVEISGPIRPYVDICDSYPEDSQVVQFWKSIDSAPKDGTVILTNEGTARYFNGWGTYEGWYLCGAHGGIPSCAEEGFRISEINPVKWTPMPE